MHDLSETLAAVATAPGRGGIGCIRLSGPSALAIADRLARPRSAAALVEDAAPRFATFLDRDGTPIDHGYAVAFSPAHAFTGESTVELWTHGSPPILEAVLAAAVAAGARPAGPGEFTYRALRNGRVDLPRAEAIRDLVAARTLVQARVAFSQVNGALARRIAPLRETLIDLVARIEAAIEFVDESETELEDALVTAGLMRAIGLAGELAADARRGRVLREGVRITLAGAPSVGKSSLFNRLLGRDRAIVSAVPGTTRDTIEEVLDLDGIAATLVDTAGLRPTRDDVEAEGVRRARTAAGEADLVLVVLDAGRPLDDEERRYLEEPQEGGPPRLVLANKWDLLCGTSPAPWPESVPVSAATGRGLDELRALLVRAVAGPLVAGPLVAEPPVVTNVRHAAALEDAARALTRAAASRSLGPEIVVEELRGALAALGEVAGETATEQLYDRIFSTFCIGK